MTRLIGLAGEMGSGKNAVADVLSQIGGYAQYAFADNLRREVAYILQTRSIPADYPDLLRDLVVCYFGKPEKAHEKPTEPKMRTILQWHGTEYRRRLYGDDYWVKACMEDISLLPRVALSDVRFENEYSAVRDHGGEIWLVRRRERANVHNENHVSEHFVRTLGPHNVDRIIDNDGSLEDLHEKVREALSCCPVAA